MTDILNFIATHAALLTVSLLVLLVAVTVVAVVWAVPRVEGGKTDREAERMEQERDAALGEALNAIWNAPRGSAVTISESADGALATSAGANGTECTTVYITPEQEARDRAKGLVTYTAPRHPALRPVTVHDNHVREVEHG